ncbi:hypothetical protein [Streptomyces sp. NPDC005970]|uniref:hypothetical protein n=1 Tax=Streptomyces sp. NPDC005970 TaxID=3156723 RepID=UPI0033D15A48
MPPHHGAWPRTYAFSTAGSHLFFGGEIAEAASLERYRAEHPRVDLALLPVNGLRPLFGPRLVMGPAHAVATDAVALAGPGLRVVDFPTGERREPVR